MNDRDFRAWADKLDNRPSYGSRTAGRINFMLSPGELVERRSYKPCFPRLERRRTQLLLMKARLDAEERFGSWISRPQALEAAEKALAKRDQIVRKLVEARARVAELTSAHPAAVERDRQARGYALAEGTPAPPSHAEQIARELEQAQELVKDLEAAAAVVEGQLQEVLDVNRDSWIQGQQRAIEQAGNGVLSALALLEQAAGQLEDERGLLAWIEPVPTESSVDPYGGRLTHSGVLAASLDQVRAAVAGLAAGEESRQPDPGREPSWVEKRLAAKAKTGWGG